MQQIIIDFGTIDIGSLSLPIRIYGYGLMMVCGFIAGILLAQRQAKRCGENPDTIPRMGILALVGGVVGARLAYVVKEWSAMGPRVERHGIGPLLDVASGGLIYYGGVIGGMALIIAYLLIRRLPWRRYLDIIAVSLMVGLAFGRAGCLLNGCCWGEETRDDWALATTFPMYAQPLANFSNTDNPYSRAQAQPSPAYQAQYYEQHVVRPDERLLNLYAYEPLGRLGPADRPDPILPAYDLHGPLDRDQLGSMFAPSREHLRPDFVKLAGEDGVVDHDEWRAGLHQPGSVLRGSEQWTEAMVFQIDDRVATLSFDEFYGYLSARAGATVWRFDRDGDGRLDAVERQAANDYLQADQIALAAACRTRPLQPAQWLGIINALLIAALVTWCFRHRRREGQAFAILLLLYPVGRFVLESLRYSESPVLTLGLTHNQWTSIAIFSVGVLFSLLLRRLPASAGPTLAQRQANREEHGTRKS
jgi:prolipoprotein diacylglyceryltransferase